MRRLENRPPSSISDDYREPVCAPQTRRLLKWGCLAVWLVLLGGVFSLWWGTRVITPALTATIVKPRRTSPRQKLDSPTTYAPEWIFLRQWNFRPKPRRLQLRKNRSRIFRMRNSGCPQDDAYGSFCDYVECSAREESTKSILLWNTRWTFEPEWTGEDGATGLIGCKPRDCVVSVRPSEVPAEAYDAVVIDVDPTLEMVWPLVRSCFQRYVFLLLQFPYIDWAALTRRSNFNWSMTFNMDSDVPLPVGRVERKSGVRVPQRRWMQPADPPVSFSEYTAMTAKIEKSPVGRAAVTWLTECTIGNPAPRNRVKAFMRSLSAYMEVHMYRVAVDHWTKADWEDFYETLSQLKYKFYFVFEFPECNHFAASHLFRVLQLNMIPVVFGSTNYSAVLPPYSYIHGGKLTNPHLLGPYLSFLLGHPNEYKKYFWWKRYYESKINTTRHLCKLCSRLHADHRKKSYGNVFDWMLKDRF